MFDIGWTEMLVVACVAIIVVGPKDLPKVLRGFGKAMKSIRSLAGDFQKQFEEAVKEADLDEVKDIASGKGFSPLDDVKKSVTAFEKDVKDQMAANAREMDEVLEDTPKGLPKPVADKLASMKGDGSSNPAASSTVVKETASASPKKPVTKKTPAKKTAKAKTSTKSPAKPKTRKTAAKKPAARKAAKSA